LDPDPWDNENLLDLAILQSRSSPLLYSSINGGTLPAVPPHRPSTDVHGAIDGIRDGFQTVTSFQKNFTVCSGLNGCAVVIVTIDETSGAQYGRSASSTASIQAAAFARDR
jgi:hypothetical protein